MKTLNDFNFENKKVLLRCDFNVPFSSDGSISDDFRIKATLPTINHLLENKAKVILISHLGRPQKIENKEDRIKKCSLIRVKNKIEELLLKEVVFLDDCIGEEVEEKIGEMKQGDVFLLENLRFYEEEEKGDLDFAEKLAGLADFYINDAFGACHRAHASVSGISKFLPSGAGFLLAKEIEVLSQVLENPSRPLVAIIGGAKIDTKINLIEQFLEKADYLILGSKPSVNVFAVKGILDRSFFSEKEEVAKAIEKIDINNKKLCLPKDGQMSLVELEEDYFRIGPIESLKKGEGVFDIGPEAAGDFMGIIKQAKMIIWNGPLGMFEKEPFDKGTKKIAEAIVKNDQAFKIIGGGDTVAALLKLNLLNKFDHISTGGGAMLEFLSGDELPGIKALN